MSTTIENAQVAYRTLYGGVQYISPCLVSIRNSAVVISYRSNNELHQIVTHLSDVSISVTRPPKDNEKEYFEKMQDATLLQQM